MCRAGRSGCPPATAGHQSHRQGRQEDRARVSGQRLNFRRPVVAVKRPCLPAGAFCPGTRLLLALLLQRAIDRRAAGRRHPNHHPQQPGCGYELASDSQVTPPGARARCRGRRRIRTRPAPRIPPPGMGDRITAIDARRRTHCRRNVKRIDTAQTTPRLPMRSSSGSRAFVLAQPSRSVRQLMHAPAALATPPALPGYRAGDNRCRASSKPQQTTPDGDRPVTPAASCPCPWPQRPPQAR